MKHKVNEIDIAHYRSLALQHQKEHRQVLAKLKKKPPNNLDKLALEIHDSVFSRIDCLTCANCCKTLGPERKRVELGKIVDHGGRRSM